MEIQFIGRKPNVDTLIKVGNVGENWVDSIIFVIERFYGKFDLADFTPVVEWSRTAGGADFVRELGIEVEENTISITWMLNDYFLNTASKAIARIVMENGLGNIWATDVVNIYIGRGVNVGEVLEKTYPENYTLMWKNIEKLQSDIALGLVKGEKGDKGEDGGITFPVFYLDEDLNLVVKNMSSKIFTLENGVLTLEVY